LRLEAHVAEGFAVELIDAGVRVVGELDMATAPDPNGQSQASTSGGAP
jgi:hypothetical protein